MDKTSGKLLQSFKSASFANTSYRLRSSLAANDALVISGTEDGRIIAWDILAATVVHELWHVDSAKDGVINKKNVVSTVKECLVRDEWCSAGGDGEMLFSILSYRNANTFRCGCRLGTTTIACAEPYAGDGQQPLAARKDQDQDK